MSLHILQKYLQTEWGLMPNVMAVLPNIGGTLCRMLLSTSQKCHSGAIWGRQLQGRHIQNLAVMVR